MSKTIAKNVTENSAQRIGLALSGGGVRASAFHAGVLLYLAEQHLLENIVYISSVSGGTLFTGLLLTSSQSSLQWPSSAAYVHDVFPYIRETLTKKSLQKEILMRLSYPRNWSSCLSRVNILAQSIKALWSIDSTLSDIPSTITWSINGSTLETGQRFSFTSWRCDDDILSNAGLNSAGLSTADMGNTVLGDDVLGYADAPNFDLASAMAVSAALPTAIGPLELERDAFSWTKGKPDQDSAPYMPPYETIHIYDGGVYDNLGIESLFDVGKQSFTKESGINFIISSDAGSPYEHTQIGNACNPHRLEKLLHLLIDQSRTLRARSLINYLRDNPQNGLYCQLGTLPHDIMENERIDNKQNKKVQQDTWLSKEEIAFAQRYKTTLNRLPSKAFDIIARHGYESAKINHQISQNHSPYGLHQPLQMN